MRHETLIKKKFYLGVVMSFTINNDLRLTGLASGLDTDSIVEGLLLTYQSKLDNQCQKTTKLEWKADAYREVNSLTKTFREEYMSVLSDSNMSSSSAYNIFDVTMIDTTNAVTISAGFSANTCSMTIDSITQLAQAAVAKSIGACESYSSDTTLADLELENMMQFDISDEISFSINGETFTFSNDTSIGGMISEINSSDAGVKMSFSSLTEGFTITSKTTGSSSSIEIINIAGNAFSAVDSAIGISEGTVIGQDALLSIEGIEVTRSSNAFAIDGIAYKLQDVSATSISFNITQDIDATVDKISGFVDAYNELTEKLNDIIDEEVHRNFEALKDAQKKEMSEEEIEEWGKKAKSGLLAGDSHISSLLTVLRSAFYTTVEGTGMSPFDIGLSTQAYSHDGQITLDENVLRQALEDDPQTVLGLFIQAPSLDSSEKFSESGLIKRISDSLLSLTESVSDVAINSLEARIGDSEDREDTLEDRLAVKEKNLWAKFTAMETALSSLNRLSTWLETLFTA